MTATRLKMKRLPRPGSNLSIHFTINKDDVELQQDVLTVAVCGVLHIAKSKCVRSYDAETGKLTLMFHFTRQVNARKASRRIDAMIGHFATCTRDIAETPAEKMLPGFRYVERFKDGTMRIRYADDGLANNTEQTKLYDVDSVREKMA